VTKVNCGLVKKYRSKTISVPAQIPKIQPRLPRFLPMIDNGTGATGDLKTPRGGKGNLIDHITSSPDNPAEHMPEGPP